MHDQVQHLPDTFWRRWIREYLPKLQQRQTWFQKKRNFAVGDVVLIVDDNCPRQFCWKLLKAGTQVFESLFFFLLSC